MEQHIGMSILPQRIAGLVLAIFGGVALVLVAIGVYGTVSYAVTTRTREIGIRIALGAQPTVARRFIVGHGLRLVAIGAAIALPLAWGAGRLLGGFLLGGSGSDPLAFGAAVAVLAIVSFVATYAPGRRASRVDPVVALRAE
jgi:ABC-type antimicrobial peptide transport system permease subunit